ncbi:MAG: rod shape-determining protein [Ferrimicrobium sp.]|jgi:rod shape-determining protein MreB|uniref:Rod shape-determining protein n=1 Tax=Ferrimicrobium acidiphilum TaxID=121039 RepID=A0ABV3Y2B2_9ACTN|nr:rod shape-determining protein [Ferrimicrobium sp.]MCL5972862.1 rod shape-determining protein [Actinomycetota bacterium]
MAFITVDIGSSQTRIQVGSEPILVVASEAAYDLDRKEVRVIGAKASEEVLRSGSKAKLVKIMRQGAPADPEAVSGFLKLALRSIGIRSFARSEVLFAATTHASQLDTASLKRCFEDLNAKPVTPLETPIAATAGINEDVLGEIGTMTVVVGESLVEAGIVSFGKLAARATSPAGIASLRNAIRESVKITCDLVISEEVANDILTQLVDVQRGHRGAQAKIWGRSLANGESESGIITEDVIFDAIVPSLDLITQTIIDCISSAPNQLVTDVADRGLWLLGGGARLVGLAAELERRLGVQVHSIDEPELAVIRGLSVVHATAPAKIYW